MDSSPVLPRSPAPSGRPLRQDHSRELPNSQSAEEVAQVIADVITTRQADVYTRPGAQAMVAEYYASLGVDP